MSNNNKTGYGLVVEYLYRSSPAQCARAFFGGQKIIGHREHLSLGGGRCENNKIGHHTVLLECTALEW